MSLQLIYTETFWWLILNLWSWQSKVFENWHHLLVVLYGYSILHLNISYAGVCPILSDPEMPRSYNTALPLFLLSAFLLSSDKDSGKPGTCPPSPFKLRCYMRQDALLKKHSNQETGSWKSQKKLMCDPALLESLQVLPLASVTIIDDL